MKCVLLVLAVLCGLSMGLQYPLSYEYEYMGQIKTGMRELRSQFAGAALKATLQVTVVSSSEAHVQIINPQVGDMNGDVPYYGRTSLPISSWSPLLDKAAVEQSFSIHFSGQQEILEVPQTEMLWISNLRKSIASLLRVPFVLSYPPNSFSNAEANRISRDDKPMTSFKKMEETVLGECRVLYTLTKAAPRKSMQLHQLKEDAQQSRRQERRSPLEAAPEADESSAYRLVRSVDLDDCSELVVITKASHGNLTRAGTGQLRGVQSRSSVGEYLLSGKPSGELSMRIEKAIVEGIVTINPFGHQTKKMMTITNQTLSLVRVTQSALVVKPSGQVKRETWMFRVESPFKRAQDSPKWMSYMEKGDELYPTYPEKDLTGFKLTQELKLQLKSQIEQDLHQIYEQMKKPNSLHSGPFGGSEDGTAAQKLESVTSKLRALPLAELQQLFEKLIKSSSDSDLVVRELTISAYKASGSPAALKVLIESMKKKELSVVEAANVFIGLTPNVVSPVVIKELIQYVKSLPDDAPIFLKSSALINLSNLIRHVCLRDASIKYTTPIPMLGQNKCSKEQVRSDYIQYLQSKVKSVSTTYLKAIYIQALVNLGDIDSVRSLTEIAEGQIFKDQTSLRILAIQGLSKFKLMNTSLPLAQKTLLAIADEQVEIPEIREAALASLFAMPQNSTFFHRMALSTWREPSRRVASFVYTSIKAVAGSTNPHFMREISMAKHVLPIAKPQPRSPFYSAISFFSSNDVNEDITSSLETSYLSSSRSMFPEQLFLKGMARLGGMRVPMIEMSATGTEMTESFRQLFESMRGSVQSSQAIRSSQFRKSHNEFESATSGHKFVSQGDEQQKSLLAQINLLEHIQVFLVKTEDSSAQLNDKTKSALASIMDKLSNKKPLEALSYYNPVDVTEMMPSEIGLPIITQISRPTMLYSDFRNTDLNTSPTTHGVIGLLKSSFINFTGEAITKIVIKSESSVKILVPWNNKTLVTGVDGESSFSLLSKFFVAFDRRHAGQKSVQVGLTPNFANQAPILLIRNLPFTTVRPLFPVRDITQQPIKPINVLNQAPRYKVSLPVSKTYTGLEAELEYQGDMQFPINASTIWESLMKPTHLARLFVTPTTRQYQLALVFSPQQSKTKSVVATASLVQMTPRSGTSSQRHGRVSVVDNLSAEDSMTERLRKISQSQTRLTTMFSLSLNLTGTEQPRKYELVSIKSLPMSESAVSSINVQRKLCNLQVNLMRSSMSGASAAQICAGASMEYPKVPQHASLDTVLNSNLLTAVKSDIYSGSSCSLQNKLYSLTASQRISQERIEHLKQMSSDIGNEDRPLDTTEAVKTSVVYDMLDLEIRERENLPLKWKNMTSRISDIIHGFIFPLFVHNKLNVNGEKGLVVLSGTRSLATDRYTIWIKSEDRICLVRDFRVWAAVDYLSPLSTYSKYYEASGRRSQMHLEAGTSDKCILTPSSVKTFAGVRYSKLPSKCATLAVKKLKEDDDKFLVITKQTHESDSAEQEVKIVYPKEELTIKIDKTGVWVNEEKVSESQPEIMSKQIPNKVLVKVTQTPTMKKIEVPSKFFVELEQGKNIIVQASEQFRTSLAGLCGKYGPDQMGDLRDSQRCLYRPEHGKHFAASWIASSEPDQCKQNASQEMKRLISEQERYQDKCPKTLQQQAGQRQWPGSEDSRDHI